MMNYLVGYTHPELSFTVHQCARFCQNPKRSHEQAVKRIVRYLLTVKRTKHMETRHFALQDWVDRDLIILKRITTSDNYSDAMTKALPRTLFYRHMEYIQGKVIPQYAKTHINDRQSIQVTTKQHTPKISKLVFMDSTQSMLSPTSRTGEEVILNPHNNPYIRSYTPFYQYTTYNIDNHNT